MNPHTNISVGLDGLDTPDSIRRLAELGADEFFAGFVPREWSETFGWEVGLNRRTFGQQSQILREDELKETIDTVHDLGRRFFLTLNAHDYGSERLPMVHDIVRLADSLEPDALIIADPAMMHMLGEWGIERPIHLSTGAACFNSESIRFYCERYPVSRVVIPRKMTLREMGRLMDAVGDLDLEFEAMIIGYRCHFNDELCFSIHCGLGSNLCSDFVKGRGVVSRRFPSDWKDTVEVALAEAEAQFQEGSALDRFRAEVYREKPAPPEPPASSTGGMDACVAHTFYNNCGLCAIPELRRLGVDVLKVPVRGSQWQKERYLQVVRTVADDPDATRTSCRALVNSAGFCSDPANCYYAVGEVRE